MRFPSGGQLGMPAQNDFWKDKANQVAQLFQRAATEPFELDRENGKRQLLDRLEVRRKGHLTLSERQPVTQQQDFQVLLGIGQTTHIKPGDQQREEMGNSERI